MKYIKEEDPRSRLEQALTWLTIVALVLYGLIVSWWGLFLAGLLIIVMVPINMGRKAEVVTTNVYLFERVETLRERSIRLSGMRQEIRSHRMEFTLVERITVVREAIKVSCQLFDSRMTKYELDKARREQRSA